MKENKKVNVRVIKPITKAESITQTDPEKEYNSVWITDRLNFQGLENHGKSIYYITTVYRCL